MQIALKLNSILLVVIALSASSALLEAQGTNLSVVKDGDSYITTSQMMTIPHGKYVLIDNPPCEGTQDAITNYSKCGGARVRIPVGAVIETAEPYARPRHTDTWQLCTLENRCNIGWGSLNGSLSIHRSPFPNENWVGIGYKNWHATRDVEFRIIVRWHYPPPPATDY